MKEKVNIKFNCVMDHLESKKKENKRKKKKM